MLEIQSFDLVFNLDGGDRALIGDIVDAAQNSDYHAEIRLSAKALFAGQVNAQLQQQIDQLQAEIGQLKLEASPDIASITPALMDAGLLAWGERATMANSEAVLGLVIELRDVAMAPRSITQCDRVKDIFGKICDRSGVVPTAGEAQAMQAILDIGPASTGPIAAKYLSFAPWM
jgi:hypothetical protein